ncbi:hypothetical protein SAMN05444395_11810 [Flavobacterium fryxellicola]|uniref:Uncharacterized protein n=1 Tax=Flavobacterium fryxellicola TaxID=249352 RepID=A0A167W1V6_9FLAO|nr:hypothetical protein [Flavobacterium fryxellicola]OAB26939.1 hypothetical protein FBFR_12575 [Flavobacterium fryxellicola]SHN79778.1 hypothetical protein SAMN05444395_11810 [Flavobacterium fryxellicola]
MIKSLFFLFLFCSSFQSYSQNLVYKSNGNITDIENNKISPAQVRALLGNNEKLLTDFNIGRTKKTIGNLLLITGPILLITGSMAAVISGFESGMNPDFDRDNKTSIPKIIAYVGLAELLIAIPVKIGFSKKIKNVVIEYNNQNASADNQFNNQKLDLITNSNGIGLRLTLK